VAVEVEERAGVGVQAGLQKARLYAGRAKLALAQPRR
jgi:hypothetical protein